MDNQLKGLLLKLLLTAGNDLGGKSVEVLVIQIENGEEIDYTNDHISAIIYNAVHQADDLQNVRNDLTYAIKQLSAALEKLKKHILNFPIKNTLTKTLQK